MKIVTVNCPEAYIDAIDKLTGNDGLYPSRSELIRVAVRDFLLKELKMADNLVMYQKKEEKPFDREKYVRVPMGEDGNGKLQTFKLVKK